MKTKPSAPQAQPHAAPTEEPLPTPERAELHRQGAKAAARGETAASNPLHDRQNLPGATGESQGTWQERQEAWQQGHDAQSGNPAASPLPEAGESTDDR